MYHAHVSSPLTPPSPRPSASAPTSPVADTWNLDDIFPNVEAWEDAYQSLDQQIIAYAGRKGTLSNAPGGAAGTRCQRQRHASVSSPTRSITTARCATTKITRNNEANGAPAARPGCCWRSGGRPRRGSIRSCSRSARPRFASWFDRAAGARALSLRAGRALSPAGTRARRKGRAAAVALRAVRHVARRHLRGAVDGRHEVSGRDAEHRRNRATSPTRAIAPIARHQP